MNVVKIEKVGKVEKSDNSNTEEERKDQDEETLRKSIIKRLRKTKS